MSDVGIRKEHLTTLEADYEPSVLAGLSEEDIVFISSLLEQIAGGSPMLGVSEDLESWVIHSTCTCETCSKFRGRHHPISCTTPIRAMREYLKARMEFITEEATFDSRAVH